MVIFLDGRTFEFELKGPPTFHLLKLAARIEKGTDLPGKSWVGEVCLKSIYEIAKIKHETMQQCDLKAVCSQMIAMAKNTGIKVVR